MTALPAETGRVDLATPEQFRPDGAVAAALDRRVRDGLASSMETVIDAIGPMLPGPAPDIGSRLRRDRAAPGHFALYAELVEAVQANASERASTLLESFEATTPLQATFRIATIDDRDLGIGSADRYGRFFLGEEKVQLLPVDAETRSRAGAMLADAVALLDAGARPFASEVGALIGEFVVVRHKLVEEGACFASATSFYLWGSMILDVSCLSDRLTAAVTLAHEAAHAYLFGLTLGAKFVANADEETFSSPLRADPRPMEGVFHASFVLARMRLCLDMLLNSDALRADERAAARSALAKLSADYADGRTTIARSAKLEPHALGLLEAMDRYMDGAGAIIPLEATA